MEPIWKVSRVTLTSDARKYGANAWYPLHVEGLNRETGEAFSWSVPAHGDRDGYDFSEAVIDADAAPLLWPSYDAWCHTLSGAAGRHGTRVAFGPETYAAYQRGETPDGYAARCPLVTISLPLDHPDRNRTVR